MLRLETISAGYAGTQVLWDVDLEAKSGEMTVIVGPNGAGKASILKVITEIFETIRRLRESGLTVLMVEQNAYQALRIADFGYVVQSGRTIRSGPPSELLDLEALRRDYFAIG